MTPGTVYITEKWVSRGGIQQTVDLQDARCYRSKPYGNKWVFLLHLGNSEGFQNFCSEGQCRICKYMWGVGDLFTALLFPALSRLSIRHISKHCHHICLGQVTSLSLGMHCFRKWGNIFPILHVFPFLQPTHYQWGWLFSYNIIIAHHPKTDYWFPSTLKELKVTWCKMQRLFKDLVHWSLIDSYQICIY